MTSRTLSRTSAPVTCLSTPPSWTWRCAREDKEPLPRVLAYQIGGIGSASLRAMLDSIMSTPFASMTTNQADCVQPQSADTSRPRPAEADSARTGGGTYLRGRLAKDREGSGRAFYPRDRR